MSGFGVHANFAVQIARIDLNRGLASALGLLESVPDRLAKIIDGQFFHFSDQSFAMVAAVIASALSTNSHFTDSMTTVIVGSYLFSAPVAQSVKPKSSVSAPAIPHPLALDTNTTLLST